MSFVFLTWCYDREAIIASGRACAMMAAKRQAKITACNHAFGAGML
jgi:hypothetical protein|tara:strand:- start:222 stop:359 length:138 start_codon:yes stop_codon:yes gene_type:complete